VQVDNELGRPPTSGRHMVYLDPKLDRAVSPYSPEGEIQMMGDFAAGLSRRGALSRPMALLLVALILAPIVLSVLAILTGF
jgi:membrane-associated PAP2 superfamily phosphatase